MSSSDVSKENNFVQGRRGGVKMVWAFCNVSYCSSVLLLTYVVVLRFGIGLACLGAMESGRAVIN